MALPSAWPLTGGLALGLDLLPPALGPPRGVLLPSEPQPETTILMLPPRRVTEPILPWVPSCLSVDADLGHGLGGGGRVALP